MKNDKNVIFNSALENKYRFCVWCHIKLVNHNNEKYVFKCPSCGVVTGIANTEPTEKLTTTFPSNPANNNVPVELNKRFVYQGTEQRLPRNVAFQIQRAHEKNKVELNDTYLRELKKRQDITITSTEYYIPDEQQ